LSNLIGRVQVVIDPVQKQIIYQIHFFKKKGHEAHLRSQVGKEIDRLLKNRNENDRYKTISDLLAVRQRGSQQTKQGVYRLENQIIATIGIEKVDVPFLEEEVYHQLQARYVKLRGFNIVKEAENYQYERICEQIASMIEELSDDSSLFSIQVPQLIDEGLPFAPLSLIDCRKLSDDDLERLVSYKKSLITRAHQEKGTSQISLIETIRSLDQAIFKLENKENLKSLYRGLIAEKIAQIDGFKIESSILKFYSPRFLKSPEFLKAIWEKSLQEAFALCILKQKEASLSDQQKKHLNDQRSIYRHKVGQLENFLQAHADQLDPKWPIKYEEALPPVERSKMEEKTPFSKEEERGLHLIAKALKIAKNKKDENPLSTEEKKSLDQFLLFLANNHSFNAKLRKISVKNQAQQFAYKFSYLTKWSPQAEALDYKLERIINHLGEDSLSALRPEEKLSMADSQALGDLARLAQLCKEALIQILRKESKKVPTTEAAISSQKG
ncbi:MAG: hypothetical protein K0S07_833, partial [Chlamydiales bacterium]|nr:hypothetical protein [Chlamydiales bacterium]